jgi:hypothetical protein
MSFLYAAFGPTSPSLYTMNSTKGLTPSEKKEYAQLRLIPSYEARRRLAELQGKIVAASQQKAKERRTEINKALQNPPSRKTGSFRGLDAKEKKELRALVKEPFTESNNERILELQAKARNFQRKHGIKSISQENERVQRAYSNLRKVYLSERPFCEICNSPASDIHHRKGRGRYTLDITTFLAACRPCHERIHKHGKWAREMGYIIDTFKDNK